MLAVKKFKDHGNTNRLFASLGFLKLTLFSFILFTNFEHIRYMLYKSKTTSFGEGGGVDSPRFPHKYGLFDIHI